MIKPWGKLSSLGLAIAGLSFLADQLHKAWMLGPYNIAGKGYVALLPFLDVVLTWNRGISYGWFAQHEGSGQWLLIALSLIITSGLILWLAKAERPIIAASLGLIIGGALGNALDRVRFGAVADFFLLHWGDFSWYVFNIADVAIVAGVILLMYDSVRNG